MISKNHLIPPQLGVASQEGLPWVKIYGVWGLEKSAQYTVQCSSGEKPESIYVAVFKSPVWYKKGERYRIENEWFLVLISCVPLMIVSNY